ncbi:helix-turn-helix domain-containing protein [Flavilitoribacter nigricans]|uniref:AraC family transcriptional regulator n=1 Tax=Flavilitoribacter nigricans (strain ATCC 23147 / DSM 23189 / NBRC 102662 / NCIMB 1420 / SS-2) TaxID=1122177 RepID=A0A2D0NEI8_FLAN2|nr:helix-turn-helix domain-containing protein [Flavilitoribacter nigricans]PHN06828.1 AraC family transcriptional regulator [Flavilitoribacter nigricans DSM 23189 = NBRC 102662]
MPKKDNKSEVPKLDAVQLLSHLFGDWKEPTEDLYESFHIDRIENYRNLIKLPILPHRRSVFYFVYVASGKITRSKLLNQYEVLPNNFFFIAANVTTSIEDIAPDTTGFYCHFHPRIFQQLRPQLDLHMDFSFFDLTAEPIIPVADSQPLVRLMEALKREYDKHQNKRFELIPLYLLTLLTEVKLANPPSSDHQKIKDPAALLTMRYKRAILELMYEKSKVFEYAEYLSVTPNHLNKYVKAATGKSARDLLSEMKIMEAKVLLKQTDLGIGEIAYKLGKMSQSDFSRFFKSKTSLTPKQYRKNTP